MADIFPPFGTDAADKSKRRLLAPLRDKPCVRAGALRAHLFDTLPFHIYGDNAPDGKHHIERGTFRVLLVDVQDGGAGDGNTRGARRHHRGGRPEPRRAFDTRAEPFHAPVRQPSRTAQEARKQGLADVRRAPPRRG